MSTGRAARRLFLTRSCAVGASVCAAALLAGCAGLAGPRTVTVSEAELQQALQRQFPFDGRLLELIDLRIASPRLRLLPASNRLATELELRIGERLLSGGYRGSLSLDHGLRYDELDQSVRLADVRVQRLRVDALPAGLQTALDRVGPVLAEQLLEGLSIYRLSADDAQKLRASGYRAQGLRVTSRGVEITLAPER